MEGWSSPGSAAAAAGAQSLCRSRANSGGRARAACPHPRSPWPGNAPGSRTGLPALLCQGEELSTWFLFLQAVIVLYKLTYGNFAPLGSLVFSACLMPCY